MAPRVINKPFLVKALVSIIIIAVGVASGLFLGNLLGFTGTAVSNSLEPEKISQDTYLKLGQLFPEVNIDNLSNYSGDLAPLLNGKKTLLCFVTSGCEPCLQFVKTIAEKPILPNDSYQIILLSPDVVYFKENYSFPAYQVNWDFLESQHIIRFPTIMGVDQSQVIKFIHTGFIPTLDAGYMEQYL